MLGGRCDRSVVIGQCERQVVDMYLWTPVVHGYSCECQVVLLEGLSLSQRQQVWAALEGLRAVGI